MSAPIFLPMLEDNRSHLSRLWLKKFSEGRTRSGLKPVAIDEGFVGAIFDEVVAMFALGNMNRIPRRHCASAFARFAVFPQAATLCVEFFEAGAQVIGGFIAGNAGTSAPWSHMMRDRLLRDLDAVVHILAQREIQILCELQWRRLLPATHHATLPRPDHSRRDERQPRSRRLHSLRN